MNWLFIIIIVLVAFWLAGLIFKIGGKLVHLILVIAIALFLLNFFGII